jgi:hypothetical protein
MRPPKTRASPWAIRATTIIAGLIGAGLMYWTWRGIYGVPLELTVPLHMDPATDRVRPWAPWWVPAALMAIVTASLWRLIAARRRGTVSIVTGALVLFLASHLTYMVGNICLEYGAMLQYQPLPPLLKMLLLFPLVILEGAQVTLLFFAMGLPIGPAIIAVGCLLVSVTIYGIGRLVSRIRPVQ